MKIFRIRVIYTWILKSKVRGKVVVMKFKGWKRPLHRFRSFNDLHRNTRLRKNTQFSDYSLRRHTLSFHIFVFVISPSVPKRGLVPDADWDMVDVTITSSKMITSIIYNKRKTWNNKVTFLPQGYVFARGKKVVPYDQWLVQNKKFRKITCFRRYRYTSIPAP
jgi:hypothetical protein